MLVPRESPLHLGHLRLLVAVVEIGAVVCSPMLAFYNRPTHLTDIIDHTVSRIIDLLAIDIAQPLAPRWSGPKRDQPTDRVADGPRP